MNLLFRLSLGTLWGGMRVGTLPWPLRSEKLKMLVVAGQRFIWGYSAVLRAFRDGGKHRRFSGGVQVVTWSILGTQKSGRWHIACGDLGLLKEGILDQRATLLLGLQGNLSCQEHALLLQRTGIFFPEHTFVTFPASVALHTYSCLHPHR